MRIIDIHTHYKPAEMGTAIISTTPNEFKPEAGEYYAVGFHPWHLPTREESWSLLAEALKHPQVLALGEAGLDKLRGPDFPHQSKAFKLQIEMAEGVGKPLIIHCVKYYNELVDIKRTASSHVPWVIHGFRGKKELAKQLVTQGFYLSFGMRYQLEALKWVPAGFLFLESDTNQTDMRLHYQEVAALRGISEEELKAAVARNVNRVFL